MLVILLSVGLLGSFIYFKSVEHLNTELGEKLLSIVKTTSLNINGDEHELLRNQEDENSVAYKKIKTYLQQVQQTNQLAYIYTLRPQGEKTEFVVDATVGEEMSHIGETYGLEKEMIQALKGQATSTKGLYTDQWGTFKSSYAPIKNSQGQVVAILCADISAQNILDARKQLQYSLVLSILIALALTLIISLLLANYLIKPINLLVKTMEELAQRGGDLTQRVQIDSQDELKDLGDAVNKILSTIQSLVKKIINTSMYLTETSQQLAISSQESSSGMEAVVESVNRLNQGAEEQNQIVTGAFELLKEIERSVEEIGLKTEASFQDFSYTLTSAKAGSKLLQNTVEQIEVVTHETNDIHEKVENLNQYSLKIKEIVQVITEIAEQTNLLALNAAIEAARAGEHGRGFNVVAEAVKGLAESSRESVQEIGQLAGQIQEEMGKALLTAGRGKGAVEKGVQALTEAEQEFINITQTVENNLTQLQQIANFSSNTNQENRKLVQVMQQIVGIVKNSSDRTEEISAALEEQSAALEEMNSVNKELADKSGEMGEMVAQFKVS